MLKEIKNIFYLLSFFIFIILTTSFYFSDQNVSATNKSRSLYSVKLNNDTQNLPLLKNDTRDIIEYRNDIDVYRKNKKSYKFWDLVGK
jgi:protocatechuate 3,4-dioxygenase beta subunit